MKIGLLTQWYAPEPGPASLPTGLAEGLAERGHDVRVLTGFPNYPHGQIAAGYQQQRRLDETISGVRVRRVALYPSHDGSAVRRVANYASFAASALVSGLDVLEDVDVVWVNYSPVTISLPMFALRRRRGTPVVVHVLDLWPDTVMASGLGRGLGSRADKTLHALCDKIYQVADTVAFISPGVGDVLLGRGVAGDKLAYAPMWADEGANFPLPPADPRGWGIGSETLVVTYAGTLGGAQDLHTLIDACAQVRDLDLVCLVAGSGTHSEYLRAHAREVGASNVRFVGRLSADEMRALNATSDVHYVGLNGHSLGKITMPSKVQAILAAGRPIVGSLDGDAAAVVESSGGWTVRPGDVAGMGGHLRAMAEMGRRDLASHGDRARAYYVSEFSHQRGVDRIEKLLIEAASRRRRG